jgi:hypothetical protein
VTLCHVTSCPLTTGPQDRTPCKPLSSLRPFYVSVVSYLGNDSNEQRIAYGARHAAVLSALGSSCAPSTAAFSLRLMLGKSMVLSQVFQQHGHASNQP